MSVLRQLRVRAWVVVLALLSIGLLTPSGSADEVPYITVDTPWLYFPGATEASSPDPAAWRQPGFDDSTWLPVAVPLGFGDRLEYGFDLSGLEPPMQRNYSSFFVRARFEVEDLARLTEFLLRVNYDDGLVVWLNGEEVLRLQVDGLKGDPTPHDATADGSHEQGNWEEYFVDDARDLLVEGENVIAAQVFNITISSADCHFNLEALDPFGPDRVPPEMAARAPFPESVVRELERIEVTFTEPVEGVDAADLLVNGRPSDSVSGEGAGPYEFRFGAPGPGEVEVRWAESTDIVDLAEDRNAFEGGSWTYLLDPDAPPAALRISEILAVNTGVLLDADGDDSDWIEILNEGDRPVNLGGYTLSDDRDEPGQWTFPAHLLAPGERVIVFASGKESAGENPDELHASFKLADGGEYLGLFSPEVPPRVVDEFRGGFPEQRPGISWGRSEQGDTGYFLEPTPGEPNGSGEPLREIVERPRFSVDAGFFDGEFDLEVFSVTPGSRLYTTQDGSVPTPDGGELYSGPIPIRGTADRPVVTVRAVAYRDGFLPSRTVTRTYIFPELVISQSSRPPGFPTQWRNGGNVVNGDYAMDARVIAASDGRERALRALDELPALSVVLDQDDLFGATRGIYTHGNLSGFNWERPCSAELLMPDGSDGFQIDSGIRVQGGSSTGPWKSLKLSLRLAFRSDYGAARLSHPLFEDSDVDDFDTLVLDAGLNLTYNHPDHGQRVRSQYVRDQYVADLQAAAGHVSVHGRQVNLFLNGVFWGVYNIHEKPDADFAVSHFGGEEEEWDSIKHAATRVVDGNALAFAELRQRSAQPAARSTYEGYRHVLELLDIDNFIDYMIVNFYAGNDDWPRHNWYVLRRRVEGETFKMVSWDAEHVLKDVNVSRLNVNNGGTPAEIYANLRNNPEFRSRFADRAERLFGPGGPLHVDPDQGAWDPDHPGRNRPAALYMRRIEEIDDAIVLESARWGDVRRPGQPYTRDLEWSNELRALQISYFPRRSERVLGQLRSAGLSASIPAPVPDLAPGVVTAGSQLSLSLAPGASGEILYTLNGVDPRVEGTGEVYSLATAFTAPIPIDSRTVVRTRVREGDEWSALRELIYRVDSRFEDLRITEIHYHAPGDLETEFVEITNVGASPLDLAGVRFTEGIEFEFDRARILQPGEAIVIAESLSGFSQIHGDVNPVGVYRGNLSNSGERLVLEDPDGQVIQELTYDDDGLWPRAADGYGASMVLLEPTSPESIDRADRWASSLFLHGRPGEGDDLPAVGSLVVIDEVLAEASAPYLPAIEIHNRSDESISLEDWQLVSGRHLAPGSVAVDLTGQPPLEAGGRRVIPLDAELEAAGFSLDPRGGEVNLVSPARGLLATSISGIKYRSRGVNRSSGYFEFEGRGYQGSLASPSFSSEPPATVEEFLESSGAVNRPARGADVVFNEIHYHPVDGDLEFIELRNTTGSEISLLDWTLEGFGAPGGSTVHTFGDLSIPEGGYLVICGVDPGFFREYFEVPEDAAVAGPVTGALDNGGEWLRLFRPRVPGGLAAELVDEVRYDDRGDWPQEPDGRGPSLERVELLSISIAPASWRVSQVRDGTPGRLNSVSSPDGGSGGHQLPGDFNQDSVFDVSDVLGLLRHLYLGAPRDLPCSGSIDDPSGGNRTLLDANGDSMVDLSDGVHGIVHLFLGGPAHLGGLECRPIPGCREACGPPG